MRSKLINTLIIIIEHISKCFVGCDLGQISIFFCKLWGKCLLVEITFDVFKFFQNQYSARAVIEAGRYLSEVPSSIL